MAPTFVETPLTRPMFADETFRDDVLRRLPTGGSGRWRRSPAPSSSSRPTRRRSSPATCWRSTEGGPPGRGVLTTRPPSVYTCVFNWGDMTTTNPASGLSALSINKIDGTALDTSELAGRAVLIVNVASKCGHTPQYAGLEPCTRQFADRGFTVLGVPCNQFGGQEPGTPEEIAEFCSTTYGVTFPLTEKIEVNGPATPAVRLARPAARCLRRAGDSSGTSRSSSSPGRLRRRALPPEDAPRVRRAPARDRVGSPTLIQKTATASRVELRSSTCRRRRR